MDALDKKILRELMVDSRVPILQLAKKARASREVVNYRIHKLQEEGIILDFITNIDISKLGFIGVAIFVSIKAKRQKEFEQFLKKSPFVSWVAELSGVWSFGFSIYGKSNEDIDKKFTEIYNAFKEDILDFRFTLHKRSHFYYEKYFGERNKLYANKEGKSFKIDLKDKSILKELSRNSRIDTVALSKKISMTAPAIAKRIHHLEKSGVIQSYSLFIDLSKVKLMQYSVFIINKDREKKNSFMSYISKNTFVSFIAEYVGDPFIELGIFVEDPYKLREVLQEIEESFPENRVIEISLFQKEFVSIGAPICVFE